MSQTVFYHRNQWPSTRVPAKVIRQEPRVPTRKECAAIQARWAVKA